MPVGAMEELWMSQAAQGSESHLTITGHHLDHAGTQPVEGTLSCFVWSPAENTCKASQEVFGCGANSPGSQLLQQR